MIKNMHFLLSCSRKHKGVYVVSSLVILSIFLMYTISVVIQNKSFTEGKFNISSGLSHGYYQEMLVYILNGIALLYFVVFLYKAPKDEGYELIIISRKNSRLQVVLSRLILSFLYLFVMSFINFAFLSIPSQLDVVLESSDRLRWLLSNFTGSLVSGTILLCVFIFLATIFNYMSSILIGSSILIAFPLVSVALFQLTTPSKELEKFDFQPLGVYQEGKVTEANIMPNVEDKVIEYPNMNFRDTKINVIGRHNLYRHDVIVKPSHKSFETLVNEYKSIVHYESVSKVDSWNAFSNYFNLFRKKEHRNSYKHKEYDRKMVKDIVGNHPNSFLEIGGHRIINLNSHFKGKDGAWNVFMGHTPYFNEMNTANVRKMIQDVVHHLNVDDADARDYKRMSFTKQMDFWMRMLNVYDASKNSIHDIIDMSLHGKTFSFKELLDNASVQFNSEKPFENRYDNVEHGYYFAKMMIDMNEARYKPISVKVLEYASQEIERDAYKGVNRIFDFDDDVYSTSVDKEYDSETPSTYILPIIASLMLAISFIVFMRKDIK